MKTMQDYTIYCTTEQACKAYKLGAPLGSDNIDDSRSIIIKFEHWKNILSIFFTNEILNEVKFIVFKFPSELSHSNIPLKYRTFEVSNLSPKFKSTGDKIDWVVEQIINCSTYDFVCMEDHIGSYYDWMDGYGIIKHYLRKNNTPYVMVSPTMVKKYAGSGKADKDMMSYYLKLDYDFDLDYIGKMANNIVDATWMAIIGYNFHKLFLEKRKILLSQPRMVILEKLNEKYEGE